ncbi:MAG: hypothetical protein JWO26_1045 [Rhodospirillales bacterium]|nr:hypothetical protein [Rhodospirillales bacterium]
MKRMLILLAALLAGAPGLQAQPLEQGQLCRAGIRAAEAGAGIPAHLLMAIGRAESSRADPQTGAFHPWPWTINAEGRGSFYPDRAAAIAAVRQLHAQGVRSIDIGCMQINLRHHPNAFASLEEAFDPVANTRYAARFLGELRAELGDWNRASAAYHSRTPEYANRYQARVAELWTQESGNPAAPALAAAQLAPRAEPAIIGAALLNHGGDRAQVIAAAPGTQGRGLDAYRGAPIALASRASSGLSSLAMGLAFRPAIVAMGRAPASPAPRPVSTASPAPAGVPFRAPHPDAFRAPVAAASGAQFGGLFLSRRM